VGDRAPAFLLPAALMGLVASGAWIALGVPAEIESVSGPPRRDKLEQLPAGKREGAIAFAFDEAVETYAARPSHADELLGKIRGRFDEERRSDGKPREQGPITKARTDAEAEAAKPRSERVAARKAG
jgi:hypothetical protein